MNINAYILKMILSFCDIDILIHFRFLCPKTVNNAIKKYIINNISWKHQLQMKPILNLSIDYESWSFHSETFNFKFYLHYAGNGQHLIKYCYSFIYKSVKSEYEILYGKNWMEYCGIILDNNVKKKIEGKYKYYSKLLYDCPSFLDKYFEYFLDKDFEHFEHFYKQNNSNNFELVPTSYYYDKYAEYLKRYKTF